MSTKQIISLVFIPLAGFLLDSIFGAHLALFALSILVAFITYYAIQEYNRSDVYPSTNLAVSEQSGIREKKCRHCAMMIPKEAKICPYCRKKQGASMVVAFFLILFIIFVFSIALNPLQRQSSDTTVANDYKACNTPKKDGTYETTRCNDLEELGKDWFFYRKKILQAVQEGDEKKANGHRRKFQEINVWLAQYKETDVDNMFSRLKDAGAK